MLKQLDLFGPGISDQQAETGKLSEEIIVETGLQLPGMGVNPLTADLVAEETRTPEPEIQQNTEDSITVSENPKNLNRNLPEKKSKRGRKSLKEMEAEVDFVEIPDDEVLFSRQYYSIGEVAAMFRVNTSLIRYWDTEFDILNPRKNRKGDRLFRPEDIKNLHLIFHLLRQRKYTIEGAKEFLKRNRPKAQQDFEMVKKLQKLRSFLLELKAGL